MDSKIDKFLRIHNKKIKLNSYLINLNNLNDKLFTIYYDYAKHFTLNSPTYIT